ncbi:MAG: hypothetical protein F6K53_42510 [Moorea sp. SIO4A1]|uniref:hypothetical protein n=1 Tax=Moorena sp. SIO4A1 TaxID=2607835 RepID=UPI00144B29E0|nr:hypothetical protein [Moorena sp. SIO4A1]NEQ63626.1 hypothetical protein [Moorena sp. SIO4A1]
MKDDDKLFEELKNQALDSEHEQGLTALGEELLKEFDSGSSQGVTDMARYRLEKHRSAYKKAYTKLMATIGL